ncbi:unnamed protein product [Cylindrotheca closterium]|uniref:Glycerophosphoryl diester phosphodiesterase membrane domain-containing protein n=1 Tax=Cylindrotheca closterium TaxID=2856 RepID=A0AAD2CNI4_9STRA|nr:unnamed protein product [Cylindrotheca closterium]
MSSEQDNNSDNNFNRLSLGATLQKTFHLYARGFKILTTLSVLTMALIGFTWCILLVSLIPFFDIEADKLSDPNYLLAHIGGFYAMIGIFQLVCVVIASVMTGPLIRAIVDLYIGKQPNLKHCLKVGVMRAPTIFCTSFLSFFLVTFGMIFLMFPGLYIGVRLFFVGPIIIVEGLGIFASMKRSWDLIAGSWCYVFCTVIFCQIFLVMLNVVFTQIILGIDATGALFSVYGTLASLVPGIIVNPIFSIVMTLMYLNMRIEKEGLNQNELIRNMGEAGALENAYTPLLDEEDFEESPLALNQQLDLEDV